MRTKSWKRKIGVVLAICMVLCGLYVPSSVILAQAESSDIDLMITSGSEDNKGDIVNITFEDMEEAEMTTSGNWTVYKHANAKSSAKVEAINGNKVLVYDNSEADTTSGIYHQLYYKFSDNASYEKVTMSYNIASKNADGVMYIPTVSNGVRNRYVDLQMNAIGGGKYGFKYAGANSTVEFEAMKWNTVKLVYEKISDTSVVYSLYINETTVAENAEASVVANTDGTVQGFHMCPYVKKSGVYYIDNIRMTTGDHEPATPVDFPTAEEDDTEENVEIVNVDFENIAVGERPSGWNITVQGEELGDIAEVQEFNGNKVLAMSNTKNYYTNVQCPLGASYDKVVMSYSVASADSSGLLYMPSPNMFINMSMNGGYIKYQPSGSTSWNIVSVKEDGAEEFKEMSTYDTMKWYTVKMVYENGAEGSTCSVYVDGKLTDVTMYKSGSTDKVAMQSTKFGTGTFYVDNIRVTTGDHEPTVPTELVANILPESINVVEENVTLPEGAHTFLTVEFTPDITTKTELSCASSDTSVVTVDEWGELVAVGVGTATVTVASAANSDLTDTVIVNVTENNVMRTIYVAANGVSTGEGTKDTPVSLAGAMELVRSLNSTMTGNIEVVLADGYYYQTDTLEFTDADGGKNNYYVIYRHEGEGEAVLSGGLQINGFTVYDSELGIYAADVPEDFQTRQLWVNDVRATRARSEGTLVNASLVSGEGYLCGNTEFLSYKHPEDLEFVFQEYWTNPRCGVTSVSQEGDKVKVVMDQPGWNSVTNKGQTSVDGVPVYYENALELLDSPGEWYLDKAENKLYYMPRPWEDINTAKVIAGNLEELIMVSGSDYDHMVENIAFEGITFADTTWMRPSTTSGHADAQNNHLRDIGDLLPEAAVTVTKANSIHFENCDFTRIGITALKMVKGVQNSRITGNRFYDISGSAVNIGDPQIAEEISNPSDVRMMMKNCDVINNYIHDIGVDYQSAVAVSVGFAANVDLAYNEIFNIPYSGFHIGYGWENRFDNVLKNMVIEHNFIHDLMGDGIFDGGAIYTLGNSGADENSYNVVSDNYIRNQMNKTGVLYPDQGTTWWKYIRNVIDLSEVESWEAGTQPKWLHANNLTEHLQVSELYTTIKNYELYSTIVPEEDDVNISYTLVEDLEWPTEAMEIINSSGLEPTYIGLRNNQAERIHLNLEDTVSLAKDASLQISVTATDGKDKAIDLADAIIAYDVKDSSVATVSTDGCITGVAPGQTIVRIYVVSNNVLDIIEKEIYVADSLKEIKIQKTEEIIELSVTNSGKKIEVYGVTELGREVELSNVSYKFEENGIAYINEAGYLIPEAVGKTTLTITGSAEGQQVSTDYTVVIKEKAEFVEDNIWEVYEKENEEKWKNTGGTWELRDEQQIVTTLNGFMTFGGCAYQDELMTFKLKIDVNGKGGWPAIVLRAQGTDKYVAGGESGYIICMGTSGLELHRYNGAMRYQIYGDVAEGANCSNAHKQGGKIVPNPVTHGQEHDIQVGALNDGDTVRVLLKVDGETVFDFSDTADEAVIDAGYFGLVGRGETFTLIKNTEIADDIGSDTDIAVQGYTAGLNVLSEEVTVGDTVNVNIAVNHSEETETAFAAGEVVVTYDNTKLSFNEEVSVLGGAAIEDSDGTLTLEDHGVDKSFGNVVYTLVFDAIADGEATVTMTSAAFINKEASSTSDLIPAAISPETVSLTVNKVAHSVTLPEGFSGEQKVTDGESYHFSIAEEDGDYYDYGEVTATMDGVTVEVKDHGDGTYTIEQVTGELVISGTRKPKQYAVYMEGTAKDDIKDAATMATYGTDYTFTMPILEGYAYKLESLTIGGVVFTDYTVNTETNVVTISGSAIKGEIVINISKTATKAAVTVTGSGAGAAAGYEPSAVIGEDYTLTVKTEEGCIYTVTAIMNGEAVEVIDNKDNTYTVKAVIGSIEFTVERVVVTDGVEVTNYLTIDASNVWLVKNRTSVGEGKVPTYDGNNMFWSEKYQAYCYLVISETFTVDEAKDKVSIGSGTAAVVDYGMDVNISGKIDASDAQLTYNIYNALYSEFTTDVTMEKFLRADVNADAVVNVADAAAIITYILANN